MIRDPSLADIAHELRRIVGLTFEQKIILWQNTEEGFKHRHEQTPALMQAFYNYEFKLQLAYDEVFCKEVGLPYARIDEHWDDLRAGIALFYYEQCTKN